MSKIIISPVKRWPGTVTLSDPLNYSMLCAWLEAQVLSRGLGTEETDLNRLRRIETLLPGVLVCVESFSLAGLPEQMTADNFPATPVLSAVRLLRWLSTEVDTLVAEAEESPNESGPPSIAT